jgi:benzoyl-CoA reductase/2-hydroxyglutaryl-CoA dehydratase subunit BcrC/BadD/HgdB
VGRRVVRAPAARADPWQALLDRYWAVPPCSTRSADPEERVRHLTGLLDRSGARGVILHLVKFCEPELFDVPLLRRAFDARGVPVLHLEGELEAELSGQTVTRLEAFVEMLAEGRAA